MKRIFVAVDISEEARQKVSSYIETLRRKFPNIRVGWDKPEKLHLTLKFLGDIDETQLENLNAAAGETAVRSPKLKLQILETGVFPNPRRARVLWLGVKDETNNFSKLHEILETECGKFGFARENRKFSPHLTVGRLREPEKSNALVQAHLQEEFFSEEFEVSDLVIYQSRLLPQGSLYSVVTKYSLG